MTDLILVLRTKTLRDHNAESVRETERESDDQKEYRSHITYSGKRLVTKSLTYDHHVYKTIDLLKHTSQKKRPIESHYMLGGITARKIRYFSTHDTVTINLRRWNK